MTEDSLKEKFDEMKLLIIENMPCPQRSTYRFSCSKHCPYLVKGKKCIHNVIEDVSDTINKNICSECGTNRFSK